MFCEIWTILLSVCRGREKVRRDIGLHRTEERDTKNERKIERWRERETERDTQRLKWREKRREKWREKKGIKEQKERAERM